MLLQIHLMAGLGVFIGFMSVVYSLRTDAVELVPILGPIARSEFPLYFWCAILIQVVMIGACFGFAMINEAGMSALVAKFI